MGFFDKFSKKSNDDNSFDSDPFASSSDLGLGATQPGTMPPPLMDEGNDPYPPSSASSSPPQSSPSYDYRPPRNPYSPSPNDSFGQSNLAPSGGFPQVPQQNSLSSSGISDSKDVQLILAKLDAIKSELDSLHQRIRKIEQIADADQQAALQQKPHYGRW